MEILSEKSETFAF